MSPSHLRPAPSRQCTPCSWNGRTYMELFLVRVGLSLTSFPKAPAEDYQIDSELRNLGSQIPRRSTPLLLELISTKPLHSMSAPKFGKYQSSCCRGTITHVIYLVVWIYKFLGSFVGVQSWSITVPNTGSNYLITTSQTFSASLLLWLIMRV